jgi:CheY-like chemotaxis protein/HPt (histidine-containing phosphotransfer) domain-containing protein
MLVIDDDEIMREVLSLLLGAEGRSVLTAGNGDAALSLLASLPFEERPSVLLTDLKMPGLSPVELATQLRAICPHPAVIVAMSGSEPGADDAEPFDAFLLKPFTVADLEAAVERARTGVAGKVQVEADPTADGALNDAIYSKLFSTMGAATLPQLYSLFMEDAQVRIGRMKSAAATDDEATFIREAHSIKGGCGMLGATELHTIAGRMETCGLSGSSLLDDFGAASERLRRILDERMKT